MHRRRRVGTWSSRPTTSSWTRPGPWSRPGGPWTRPRPTSPPPWTAGASRTSASATAPPSGWRRSSDSPVRTPPGGSGWAAGSGSWTRWTRLWRTVPSRSSTPGSWRTPPTREWPTSWSGPRPSSWTWPASFASSGGRQRSAASSTSRTRTAATTPARRATGCACPRPSTACWNWREPSSATSASRCATRWRQRPTACSAATRTTRRWPASRCPADPDCGQRHWRNWSAAASPPAADSPVPPRLRTSPSSFPWTTPRSGDRAHQLPSRIPRAGRYRSRPRTSSVAIPCSGRWWWTHSGFHWTWARRSAWGTGTSVVRLPPGTAGACSRAATPPTRGRTSTT